jgi:hypothetical protein
VSEPGCVEFIKLRHPSNDGSQDSFALVRIDSSPKCQRLLELHRTESDSVSCFVGNMVRKDGAIYALTDVDPNFFLLHLLEDQRSRTVPLDQLLRVDGFPFYAKLITCEGANISLLADVDDKTSSHVLVRLNDQKCLKYLQRRIERVGEYLMRTETATMDSLGTSGNFNGPSGSSNERQVQYAVNVKRKEAERLALQLIFDYLPERWRAKLADELQWTVAKAISGESFKGESESSKALKPEAPLTWEEENGYMVPGGETIDQMRFGTRPDLPKSQGREQKKAKLATPPMTIAQKKLAQVNKKGIPSITSFFGAPKPSASSSSQ